jgi:DNA replication protein DnaC
MILYPDNLQAEIDAGAVPLTTGEPIANPRCENCNDLGRVMVWKVTGGPSQWPPTGKGSIKWMDLDRGEGWYSGEMLSDTCTACNESGRRLYLITVSGLSGNELDTKLHHFLADGALARKAPAIEAARNVLEMGRKAHGFLTYHGGYGVGKTLLLKALVNEYRMIGHPAAYRTMAGLLGEIRENFGDNQGVNPRSLGVNRVEDVIEYYARRAKVLALDEVDRVNLTDWAKETIFRLINARYENQGELLTIVATNTAPDNLDQELQYLASRMKSGQIVEVPGPDMRPAQGMKQNEWTDR